MNEAFILIFIGGILGGLAVGFFVNKFSLGTLKNALVGLAGGVLFAYLQQAVGLARAEDVQDLGVIVIRLVVGLVGGFLFTALIGALRKSRAK
ncbi:MAG: hypothetical protein KAZ45_03710 [Arenimonas sp.]|nr:hypothetical protein [Arenimonas sp.]MBP7917554.1 hypothetical protein [Arenimonas sp.]